MIVNMKTIGADKVIGEFRAAATAIEPKIDAALHHFGPLLETYIKANASGRPGPRTITGDYRRSWSTEYGQVKGSRAAVVGTNAPQGRRLEYGFVGVDSLGRHYDQPPFLHVQPAVDRIRDPFETAIARLADV